MYCGALRGSPRLCGARYRLLALRRGPQAFFCVFDGFAKPGEDDVTFSLWVYVGFSAVRQISRPSHKAVRLASCRQRGRLYVVRGAINDSASDSV